MTTNPSTLSTAQAEHQAGRLPQAEAIYRDHLARFPQDLAALIGLGDVLVDSGQITAAEEFYRRAIAVDGESPAATGAYDGLATVLQAKGDLDDAAAGTAGACDGGTLSHCLGSLWRGDSALPRRDRRTSAGGGEPLQPGDRAATHR
jgi:predicted Zn-dependent protease